jgi:hypothetical protein
VKNLKQGRSPDNNARASLQFFYSCLLTLGSALSRQRRAHSCSVAGGCTYPAL